ncbi:phosphogluconate dehydrogenase C-terminal domain-containing protein [Tautonia plasticadhaerens]|uniref:Prephenate dehydrogenase n=1 Tax=Tautonia plasticadhaerens TaxID=2527974 RepID=A0A518H1K9_9BACT|nr:phosphogluconate dehydrogenase C-terminal domain-containing protein [Tautonia plasticadhaerens]QDV34723.1 prephenate dehydrogenase [Tautonia plasticadhaerens]
MTTIALLGAGGKMGCRIADNLRNRDEYRMRYVEIGPAGRERLAERGLDVTPRDGALAEADVVIFAVPDALMGTIAAEAVPLMKPGAMLMGLDPAAPHAGVLPLRDDLSYFFTHPCHPPVFNDETDPEARRDFFGGIKAKQHIVCALMKGPDADYAKGEAIARAMYAPVMRSHRITVEQMALLEPALAETTAATCITVVKEAMDEAVRLGVPPEAARDFLLGHINIELAIVFGEIGSPFSDGALKAIARAKGMIFRPDWKRVFDPENLRESVRDITTPPPARSEEIRP